MMLKYLLLLTVILIAMLLYAAFISQWRLFGKIILFAGMFSLLSYKVSRMAAKNKKISTNL